MRIRVNSKSICATKHIISSIKDDPEPLMEDQSTPPKYLIKVVETVNAKVIKHLKNNPKELYNLRPRQFEKLTAEVLAFFGWQVQLTSYTRDGGYDLYTIQQISRV